jgi:hypothetical protein
MAKARPFWSSLRTQSLTINYTRTTFEKRDTFFNDLGLFSLPSRDGEHGLGPRARFGVEKIVGSLSVARHVVRVLPVLLGF